MLTELGIPSDSRSTLTNEEWRINSQLRLGLPLASYHNLPHEACMSACVPFEKGLALVAVMLV